MKWLLEAKTKDECFYLICRQLFRAKIHIMTHLGETSEDCICRLEKCDDEIKIYYNSLSDNYK